RTSSAIAPPARSSTSASPGVTDVKGPSPPATVPLLQMRGPLPKAEFDAIFAKVPRLTVEVLIASPQRGVLLALRDVEPCKGTWNLPGGTVRFGEPLVDAVKRVAAAELCVEVSVGAMRGYIEYPSHYENGLDSPVGIVFDAQP